MEAITANQLRVGNIIFDTYGDQVGTIEGLLKKRVFIELEGGHLETDYDCITGVELTEEWLIRFGFEESKHFFRKKMFITTCLEVSKNPNKDFKDCSIVNDEIGLWFRSIFYVHQLQNLYFALTNEELKIK